MTEATVQVETPETQGTPAPESSPEIQPEEGKKPDAPAIPDQDGEEEGKPEAESKKSEEGTKDERKSDTDSPRVQKRINEMTYQVRERDRTIADQSKQIAELKEKLSAKTAASRPKREDFESEEQYEDAVFDWRKESDSYKSEEKPKQESNPRLDEARARFEKSEEDYAQANPDYDEDIKTLVWPQNQTGVYVAHMIAGLENGPQVLHELSKDLDLQDDIFKRTPEVAAQKIQRVARDLAKPKVPEPKPKKELPDPIEPVKPSALKTELSGRELRKQAGLID